MINNEDVKDLIKDLEEKEANKMKLTVGELVILDVHRVLQKEGKEISSKIVDQIKFMMD